MDPRTSEGYIHPDSHSTSATVPNPRIRAKQPVSVAGIEFDALIEEERSFEASVPQYPVEGGYSIGDSIQFGSESLKMTLFVTDTPVTWLKKHGTGRTMMVCKLLEDTYFKGQLVTVLTTDATYTDMAIESISFTKSVDVGYAREIPIVFRKVRKANAMTVTTEVVTDYGKGGATEEKDGLANTSGDASILSAGETSGRGNSGKKSAVAQFFADLLEMAGNNVIISGAMH